MTSDTLRITAAPLLAAAALLTLLTASPGAQRRRGGGDASLGAPVSTTSVVSAPDAYVGKPVTLSAGVDQVLSRTAFVVDQRKADGTKAVKPVGTPLMVIAPDMDGVLAKDAYLLLKGQIVMFDAAAMTRVAPGYALDLSPELVRKYEGQPVLVATSVLTSTYTELIKKPAMPPPAAKAAATTSAP